MNFRRLFRAAQFQSGLHWQALLFPAGVMQPEPANLETNFRDTRIAIGNRCLVWSGPSKEKVRGEY